MAYCKWTWSTQFIHVCSYKYTNGQLQRNLYNNSQLLNNISRDPLHDSTNHVSEFYKLQFIKLSVLVIFVPRRQVIIINCSYNLLVHLITGNFTSYICSTNEITLKFIMQQASDICLLIYMASDRYSAMIGLLDLQI